MIVTAAASAIAARQNLPAANPLAGSPAAAGAGETLFSQLCQSCHGPAGQGAGERGPALNSGTFTHGSADGDLFRTIRSGIRGTQMAPSAGLSDTQVWQLVTYVRTLAPAARPGAALAPGPGDAPAGEALFFGRAACSGCHEVNARGGIIGPELSNAGRLPPAVLQAKITSPDDLLALADAVRDAGLSYDSPAGPITDPAPRRGGMVELARRGHLTVLADPGAD